MDLVLLVFVLLILYRSKLNFRGFHDCLSIQATNRIRGIAILVVVFSHLSPYEVKFSLFQCVFLFAGTMAVSIFFFFSGYGLLRSHMAKENYASSFVRKRILPILSSYLVFTLIYWIGRSFLGERITFIHLLQSFFNGSPVVTDSWYVIALLLFYVFFYLLMKLFGKKYWLILGGCTLYVIGWIALCSLLGCERYWYITLHFLCIGMLVALTEHKLIPLLKKRYLWFFVGIVPLFSILFLLKIRFIPITAVGEHVMRLLFIGSIVLITMKLQINNPFLNLLSDISLEYYLIHRLIMNLLRSSYIYIENYTLWCVSVIILSFVCALGLHWLLKKMNAALWK